MFKGKAMTYYGRWTYKYEIASEKGAAAAIIVHETGRRATLTRSSSGAGGGRTSTSRQRGATNRVAVEAWMTLDTAKELFAARGPQLRRPEQGRQHAKDFRPVALNAKATFHVRNNVREIQSKNVIAKLEGSDPTLKNEYVIYTAHWDHLGKDTTAQGRPDLQRRARQRVGDRRAPRDGEGVQGAAEATARGRSSSWR